MLSREIMPDKIEGIRGFLNRFLIDIDSILTRFQDTNTVWKGNYVTNEVYQKNELVKDGCWTMIANKPTADKPGPAPTGTPYFYFTGTMTDQSTSKQVENIWFGTRYTWGTEGGYITAYRVYAAIGQTYDIFSRRGGRLTPLGTFTAEVTGWVTQDIPPEIVLPLETFDLMVLMVETANNQVIPYGEDTGYYTGNVNARGLWAEDAGPETTAEDDNAYGVDIQVQPALVSDDWDIVSYNC